MARQHHQLNGHESEQTPGDSEGQGKTACYRPWGRTESDTTEATQQQPSLSKVGTIIFFLFADDKTKVWRC